MVLDGSKIVSSITMVWKHARTVNFQALRMIIAVFGQAHESPGERDIGWTSALDPVC